MRITAIPGRVLCIPGRFRWCCQDKGHVNVTPKENAKALFSIRLNESAVEEQLILGKLGKGTG